MYCIIIGVKSSGSDLLCQGGWSYSMIPVDGMQKIHLEFGIFVLLTCLAELLRWAF